MWHTLGSWTFPANGYVHPLCSWVFHSINSTDFEKQKKWTKTPEPPPISFVSGKLTSISACLI